MSDILDELRADDLGWIHPGVAAKAADEIERLRDELYYCKKSLELSRDCSMCSWYKLELGRWRAKSGWKA